MQRNWCMVNVGFFFSLQLLKESDNGPRIHLHFSNLVMNRGLSCHISEGYRLCGNWDKWQKKGEERSSLNASDPRSEAVTERGSLCAALVSLNHERFPIMEGGLQRYLLSLVRQWRGHNPELWKAQECHQSRLLQPGKWKSGGKWTSSWSGSAWGTVCVVNQWVGCG